MRRSAGSFGIQVAAAAAVVIAASGCGNKHYLAQYQFSDRTLALEYIEPPAPELLHGFYDLSVGDNAVQSIMRAGGTVAKEVVAQRASARLDSASRLVDVSDRLAQRTLERASRYLGTRAVNESRGADFVLEVNMKEFGLDARSSTASYLYTRAEAVLLDRQTGREIWSVDVHGRERLTPWIHGTANVPSSVINAGTLSTVTVQQFQDALDQLVTYTSQLVTDELRDKLRDVRDR